MTMLPLKVLKSLFWLTWLVAFVGVVIVAGGLGATVAFCEDNQPLGIAAGFKQPYQTIMIAQAQTTGVTVDCADHWRFDWWIWSLQVIWLILVVIVYACGTLHRYKVALGVVIAPAISWHMERCDFIVENDPRTFGTLHTRGMVTLIGLVACCVGDFLLMFAMCAYGESFAKERASADVSSSDQLKEVHV